LGLVYDPEAARPPAAAGILNNHFQSIDNFNVVFAQTASSIFGSGWADVDVNTDKPVSVHESSDTANPIKDGDI
jgi:superoxide dismutase